MGEEGQREDRGSGGASWGGGCRGKLYFNTSTTSNFATFSSTSAAYVAPTSSNFLSVTSGDRDGGEVGVGEVGKCGDGGSDRGS